VNGWDECGAIDPSAPSRVPNVDHQGVDLNDQIRQRIPADLAEWCDNALRTFSVAYCPNLTRKGADRPVAASRKSLATASPSGRS
jgi:hypothetical protein